MCLATLFSLGEGTPQAGTTPNPIVQASVTAREVKAKGAKKTSVPVVPLRKTTNGPAKSDAPVRSQSSSG